jgi:hypothetical protein
MAEAVVSKMISGQVMVGDLEISSGEGGPGWWNPGFPSSPLSPHSFLHPMASSLDKRHTPWQDQGSCISRVNTRGRVRVSSSLS